jgi:DNA-binding NarL/FixJ family response regulator
VAEGCSNPEIAERLVMSRRTAEHRVQRIYAKLGVASRAAVALFALEHDLL